MKYNIPVALWLGEKYPRTPPTLYVRPTADMVIKPRHALVDGSGLVSTPYLSAWDGEGPRPGLFGGGSSSGSGGGSSNLVDLCHDTSIRFGADPPLYSKPPGWTGDEAADVAAATAAATATTASSSGGGGGGGGSGSGSGSGSGGAQQQGHPEFCNPMIHGPSSSGGGGGGGGIWGGRWLRWPRRSPGGLSPSPEEGQRRQRRQQR